MIWAQLFFLPILRSSIGYYSLNRQDLMQWGRTTDSGSKKTWRNEKEAERTRNKSFLKKLLFKKLFVWRIHTCQSEWWWPINHEWILVCSIARSAAFYCLCIQTEKQLRAPTIVSSHSCLVHDGRVTDFGSNFWTHPSILCCAVTYICLLCYSVSVQSWELCVGGKFMTTWCIFTIDMSRHSTGIKMADAYTHDVLCLTTQEACLLCILLPCVSPTLCYGAFGRLIIFIRHSPLRLVLLRGMFVHEAWCTCHEAIWWVS